MRYYILHRLLISLPVIFGVLTLVFLLIHFIPGDPVQIMLGETAEAADVEEMQHLLGLDQPISLQYWHFLSKLFKGDLGYSLHNKQPVMSCVLERLPATLELTLASLIVAILIALPLGIISAIRVNTLLDRSSMFLSLIGVSMPNFWLGPLLILTFAIGLDWLPVSGRGSFLHLILPAITLGTGMAAILTRLIRANLLEVIGQDYIIAARSRGLPESRIIFVHALKNALIPVVTILGLQFGSLLSGSIITETIFAWPGVGRLTINAIATRDYPLVQGCVLVIALIYVLVNLFTDLLYGFLDPRIRFQGEKN